MLRAIGLAIAMCGHEWEKNESCLIGSLMGSLCVGPAVLFDREFVSRSLV